ncbi:MAG TPA: CoA pyrophosphatase [Flavobacteriaceae bacterium]|nr:CoA pyrophosphatase [Flavobacteriaceae bacterium]HEX5743475.1 CoA pyrophosphatase [Flavobacteriaceae bacterium]
MQFDFFLSNILKLQQLPLGGLDSQYKMAPELRKLIDHENIHLRNPKEAAVLVLFFPNEFNETMFILTKRAKYNGVHSSQISFPGGKHEYADILMKTTALREANEEIGINKEDINLFKTLTKVYIPPSNFWVTPYLGYINYHPFYYKNDEVENVLEIKLSDLIDVKNLTSVNINTSYAENIDVPCFKLNDEIVWGATAMMLSEIYDLIKLL